MTSDALIAELQALAQPEQALHLMRFFRTGPGQYGEGDRFLGIKMPPLRELARRYRDLPQHELSPLLDAPWHEMRMTGLLILQLQYQRSDEAGKAECFDFLLAHLKALNNWDLVDVIVPGTIGDYLWRKPAERERLQTWIASPDLWERRIALLASLAFIRRRETALTGELAAQVLADDQDLIHKASGWMLREAGKRDPASLYAFLETHAAVMPRTMLRYAIEKLSPAERADYMARRARQI